MAQGGTDFSEYTIGQAPADWSLEWGGVTREIVSGNPLNDSDRSLQITATGGDFTHNALSWDDAGTAAVAAAFARLTADFDESVATDTVICSPVLCGAGGTGTYTGYYALVRETTVSIRKAVNGSHTTHGSVSSPLPVGLGQDISIELSVDNTGLVELYVWESADPKPETPTTSYEDPSPLGAGWLGFHDLSNNGHGGIQLHFYGYGTSGDAPLTSYAVVPQLTVTQTELTPSGIVSGSYEGYETIPTILTVSDGANTITIASPTISDNGDGTGTFSGTMPALPDLLEFNENTNYQVGDKFQYSGEIYEVIATQAQPNAAPPNATYYTVASGPTASLILFGDATVELT